MEAVKKTERHCLLYLAQSAREANASQTALRCITAVRNLEGPSPTLDTLREFAHVLWTHREEKLAIEAVDQLLARADKSSGASRALILSQQVGRLTGHSFAA